MRPWYKRAADSAVCVVFEWWPLLILGAFGLFLLVMAVRESERSWDREDRVLTLAEAYFARQEPALLTETEEHREAAALREGVGASPYEAHSAEPPTGTRSHPTFTDADLDALPNPATRHYGAIDPTGLPVDDYAAMVMLADWCLDLSYCPRCDARTPLCACQRDSDGELLEEQASDMVEEIRDSEVLGALRAMAECPEGKAFLAEVRKLYAGESLEKAVTVRALAAELWKLDPVTREVVGGIR